MSGEGVPVVDLLLEAFRVERCECGRAVVRRTVIVVANEGYAFELRANGCLIAAFDSDRGRRDACWAACRLYDLIRGELPGATEYKG